MPNYDDLEDLDEVGDALWHVNEKVERYMSRATFIVEEAESEMQAQAALKAVERAASFYVDSSWNSDRADINYRRDVLEARRKGHRLRREASRGLSGIRC